MKKVLFLTNLPTPYRINFYSELGKYCDLTVVFESKRDKKLLFDWNDESVSNFQAIFLNSTFLDEKKINISIFKYVFNKEYDAIFVSCYYTWTEILVLLYLKFFRKSYYFETDGGMIATAESKLLKKIKTFLISGATKYFSPSKGTDIYLKYYGARSTIQRYPFTSLYQNDILQKLDTPLVKKGYKDNLGIKEKKIILAVGQFIHRKGFDILMQSCQFLNKEIGVYFVGGVPTSEYLTLQQKLGLSNVYFEGFKTKKELEEWFRAADVFVLPTREDIWGLVINEAMGYGLPVVTTDKCVAGQELIKDQACIVPVGDSNALAEIINKIINNEEYAYKLALENINSISSRTFEKMARIHIENL